MDEFDKSDSYLSLSKRLKRKNPEGGGVGREGMKGITTRRRNYNKKRGRAEEIGDNIATKKAKKKNHFCHF